MSQRKAREALDAIAGMTPEAALTEVGTMRALLTGMLNDRLTTDTLSVETKEFLRAYYQPKLDALDIAGGAIVKAFGLKVDKHV